MVFSSVLIVLFSYFATAAFIFRIRGTAMKPSKFFITGKPGNCGAFPAFTAPSGYFYPSGYFHPVQSAILRRDLPIYRNIYSDEILTTLPAGTEVFWSATDGVEWMYLDSFGTGGWIRFRGEYVILNGEELYHADVFFLPSEAG